MALDLPETADEVVQRSKTDVQRELLESNPFLKNSWLGALVTAAANRIFDFYVQLTEAIELSFPDTTSGVFLDRWSTIYGVPRNAATQSTGNIVGTGTAGSAIALNTLFQSTDGLTYQSTALATIGLTSLVVLSIVRTGTTATVTTTTNHGIASNVAVTIAGADQAEYNGVQTVIVTGNTTFEYTVSGSPTTPATGSITADVTTASVTVRSIDFGFDTNQSLDAVLTIQTPIAGVDNAFNVDVGALGGGVDQESDADSRVRMLDRIQNPVAHFSASDITAKAKTVAGVTRVFVQTAIPARGQVTIFFMRDNDDDPIPTSSEVQTVNDTLLEILPSHNDVTDMIVLAPTPKTVSFTFTNINPDTATMQTAIQNSLSQFFQEETEVGINIDQDAYRSAIFNTVDTANGATLASFTLSDPVGDIVITTAEIGVLGGVIFP